MIRQAFLGCVGLFMVACASNGGDPPAIVETRICEANPEQDVQTQALVPNRIALNRIALNRIALNRIALNRIALNRISLNRISLNRISLNRIALNRIALNRIALNGVELQGVDSNNELVGLTDQGEVIGGEAFVGAKVTGILSDGRSIDLDITSFERTSDPAIVHYGLAFQGENICEGGTTGMFIPGIWDETGKRTDSQDSLTVSYSCVDGVIAKCAAWGYASWKVGGDLHAACTRMGTADYCGNGTSYTKDGTEIDVFDRKGILTSANDPSFMFEAAWSPNGAVCVNRPRYDARSAVTGASVLPSCWSSLPKCDSLSTAASSQATIANASRPQSRVLCE